MEVNCSTSACSIDPFDELSLKLSAMGKLDITPFHKVPVEVVKNYFYALSCHQKVSMQVINKYISESRFGKKQYWIMYTPQEIFITCIIRGQYGKAFWNLQNQVGCLVK